MGLEITNTADAVKEEGSFVLLYGASGVGKTTNAKFYQEKFGKTLILSTERGTRSLHDVKIDKIEIDSWEKFAEQCKFIQAKTFKDLGYKCLVIDSLSKLTEMLYEWLELKHVNTDNRYEIWTDYRKKVIGVLNWLRHTGYHVLVICLAEEYRDANLKRIIEPSIKGNKVQAEISAEFDYVWNLSIVDAKTEKGNVTKWCITTRDYDSNLGFIRAKTRAPMTKKVLKKVEETSSVPDLIIKIEGSEAPSETSTTETKENE